MRSTQPVQAGTYVCPVCGATYQALGHETAITCTSQGRHHLAQMQPADTADNDAKQTA